MWNFDVCGMTDVGKKRPRNEDHFLVATLSKSLEVSHSSLDICEETRLFGNSQGRLLLVADGMGGHAAGERASAMVVSAFADYVLNMLRWYFRADPQREADLAADLGDAVIRCQRSIRDEVRVHPEEQGMGTTLTLAYVIWPRMFVVQVGDSRCYVMRAGKLRQLTRDHSMVQQMLENHAISPNEAEHSPWRHVLWNVVGGNDDDPKPDIFRVDLEFDDRLLLCTDGLTNHVSDEDLAWRLQQEQPAFEICRQMIEQANAAGGSDNITAIVAKFSKPSLVGEERSAKATVPTPPADSSADTALYEPVHATVI